MSLFFPDRNAIKWIGVQNKSNWTHPMFNFNDNLYMDGNYNDTFNIITIWTHPCTLLIIMTICTWMVNPLIYWRRPELSPSLFPTGGGCRVDHRRAGGDDRRTRTSVVIPMVKLEAKTMGKPMGYPFNNGGVHLVVHPTNRGCGLVHPLVISGRLAPTCPIEITRVITHLRLVGWTTKHRKKPWKQRAGAFSLSTFDFRGFVGELTTTTRIEVNGVFPHVRLPEEFYISWFTNPINKRSEVKLS